MVYIHAAAQPTSSVTKSVTLRKVPPSSTDPIDPSPEGKRTSSIPYVCLVSENGVDIPDFDQNDVLSYEVWSEEAECHVSFSDDVAFAMYVINVNSDCVIVLRFESFSLMGNVND